MGAGFGCSGATGEYGGGGRPGRRWWSIAKRFTLGDYRQKIQNICIWR